MSFLSHELGQPSPRRTHAVEGQESLFNRDTTERKHGGNANSVAAHERVKETKQATCERIWHLLRKHPLGLTSKEIAAKLGKPLNAISGRFKDLRELGWITTLEYTRDGAAVHIFRPRTDVLSSVEVQ
jgi:hypothetical protein